MEIINNEHIQTTLQYKHNNKEKSGQRPATRKGFSLIHNRLKYELNYATIFSHTLQYNFHANLGVPQQHTTDEDHGSCAIAVVVVTAARCGVLHALSRVVTDTQQELSMSRTHSCQSHWHTTVNVTDTQELSMSPTHNSQCHWHNNCQHHWHVHTTVNVTSTQQQMSQQMSMTQQQNVYVTDTT
jgi:hypothetical protein